MRHINGVYTQRYNRQKKTDGSLFRGRYKATLVDKDAYLLQLSRYIHRNPIETKRPLVQQLDNYPWSSYPAYINKAKTPDCVWRQLLSNQLIHGIGVGEIVNYHGNALNGPNNLKCYYFGRRPGYVAPTTAVPLTESISWVKR